MRFDIPVKVELEPAFSVRLLRFVKLANTVFVIPKFPLSPRPTRLGSDRRGVGSAIRLSFRSKCLSRLRFVKNVALLIELSNSHRLVKFKFVSAV